MNEDELRSFTDARSNCNNPYTFQPVTLIDNVAAVAVSSIATLSAIALLRSHARNRRLSAQLVDQVQERS